VKLSTLVVWLGGAVGGGLAGWLASPLGMFGAFMISLVGTAAGIYFTRRFARQYLA